MGKKRSGVVLDSVKIGSKLRSLRHEKGKTIKEVAEDANMPYSQLAQYETGTRSPSIKGLEKLSKYYDVDVAYIIGQNNVRKVKDTEILESEKEINDVYEKYLLADEKTQTLIDMIMG